MKKIVLISFVCLLAAGVFSCKKKKPASPASPGNAASGTNEQNYTDLTNCYGEVYFLDYIAINKGSFGYRPNPVELRVFSNSILDPMKNDADAGKVTVNSIVLKRNGGSFTHRVYSDSTRQLFSLSAFTLSAAGSPSVLPFNFQYNSGSPVFADTNLIPSVVKRSQGINLVLTGINNADSVLFSFQRSDFQAIKRQVSTKGLKEAKIEIKGDEISTLMGSYIQADIILTIFKKVLIRAGGKDYLVHSRKVYSRPVLVDFF